MKLNRAQDFDRFLKSRPADIEVVVLHGADQGLIHERALAIENAVLGKTPNPFQKVELTEADIKEAPGRLLEEADAITMLGGTKFIRLRMSNDVALRTLRAFQDDRTPTGASLICLEAGELRGTSALRKFAEGSSHIAAILCAHDTAAGLEEVIRARFKSANIETDREAFALLMERLGADRGLTVRELEKLEAYAGFGPGPHKLTASDVQAIVGDTNSAASDEIVDATFTGDSKRLGIALDRAASAGINPIQVLRLAQNQADRISRRLAGQRTPMGYYQEEWLKRHLSKWNGRLVTRARSLLYEAERQCKVTGLPARDLCERALLSIASGINR